VTGIEFNRRVEAIPVYPAASTYAFDGELVKLASNETPFPPHPQVLEAVEAQLRTLNRYPDPAKATLRRRLSERTGVAPGRIAIGNGSCELLLSAAEAMLEPGAEVVYAWPAFSIYPHLAAMSGARAIEVPLSDAQEHDLDAMAKEITAATRMLIVCNPNNPTATALAPAALDEFLKAVPRNVAVFLDEAYVEFNTLQDPDESLDLLKKHPNLLEGVWPLRPARGLLARLGGVPARGRPRQAAVLGERPRAGGRDRGAQPRGRGRAAR
jgi:histidinol-phosphate aminotransferase